MTRYFLVLFIFSASLSSLLHAKSEMLPVAIHSAVAESLPNFSERVERALSPTGIAFTIDVYPPARSIELLKKGTVGLEFFRTPDVMQEGENLARLEPVVYEAAFKMFTSSRTPSFCSVDESDFKGMSTAGLRGILLHRTFFAPKFSENHTFDNVRSFFRFVTLGRADVGFAFQPIFEKAYQESIQDFVICDSHQKTFRFYPYLHKDFVWAKEKIERSLLEEFGESSIEP